MRLAAPLLLGSLLIAGSALLAQEQGSPPFGGRYQLVESNQREVLVLDRRSGVLFAVNLRLRTAMMIDAARGHAIARPLVESFLEAEPGQPTWPTRDELSQRGAPGRYLAPPGDTPSVFDTATGRVYLLGGPTELRIVDAVEGRLTRRAVNLEDRAVLLTELEQRAADTLRAIAVAQQAFRTTDRDPDGPADYGDLAALTRAGLVSEEVAQVPAYRIQVVASSQAPAQRWIGVATPLAGGRHFVVNHLGVVHRCDEAFPLDAAECTLPPTAVPLD